MPIFVEEPELGTDGASDGKSSSSKRPAEDDAAQPESEVVRKVKHIKWRSADLPTTQAQRAATANLVYGFKKLGGFDSARKRTFTRFDESQHKDGLVTAIQNLAEQELDNNPSLLAKDRRQAAPLIEGKAERFNLYATVEGIVDQFIDDMLGTEAEAQLREIRRGQVGEAQAAEEQQRGARTEEFYFAQSAERRAKWAEERAAKEEEQRQHDMEERRKREKELELKLQEELAEKERKLKKEKEMEEYRALKARQDAEWALEQKMLDQREAAKRKKEEAKAIEEAALRELIEEGKRMAAKSTRGDTTAAAAPVTKKGKESALAAIMRAEKLEKEAGPASKAASEAGQDESPAPPTPVVEVQRKAPILKFGHAGGGTRPPKDPSYDRSSSHDQYYQEHGYGYKHSYHSRFEYPRESHKYAEDRDYSDRRYESKEYESSSRQSRDDDYYREKEYRDKYAKEYRDKYDKYDDHYDRDDKYKYDTRDDRDSRDRRESYHDHGRRSSVEHRDEERSSRRSEHDRRGYEEAEAYYSTKDKDYSRPSSRRDTLSKHESGDMPPPARPDSRYTKESSNRARSEDGEYVDNGGKKDRHAESTSRSARSPSRRESVRDSSKHRQDSPRGHRKRSRSRERDGIDRYVPSSSSKRDEVDREAEHKRDRDRDSRSFKDEKDYYDRRESGYERGKDRDHDDRKRYDEDRSYSRGGGREERDHHERERKSDRRRDYDGERNQEYHSKKYDEDYYDEHDHRNVYHEYRDRLDDSRDRFDARAHRGSKEETHYYLPSKSEKARQSDDKYEETKDKELKHRDTKPSSSTAAPRSITEDPIYEWLHVLRLHKYTPNLSHLEWRDLINLDDAALEKLGVSTQGARSKLLKAFDTERERLKR